MNELNDIILSIEKDKIKEESSIKEFYPIKEEKKEDEFLFDKELKEWILHLKQELLKRYYKRALKDISSAGLINKFKKSPYGYKIIILSIKAKLKIIENKLYKYHINPIEANKHKHQISHCFSYIKVINNELILLVEQISDIVDNSYYNNINKRNYKIELFDDIIRLHFDYIYTMSIFHYKIGNSMEVISFLSLFISFYKKTKLYILSTHTLYKIQKCYILLSKIYIINNDYENGLEILNESINICFKQILFQVQELYLGVFIGNTNDLMNKENDDLLLLKDLRIKRIILNIIIIFFYKGIVNEKISDIKKATTFYKQCEWFSRTFLLKTNKIIYKFCYNIKNKGIEVSEIISFIKEKIKIYEGNQWKNKKEDYKEIRNKKYKKYKAKLFCATKFKGLVKKLEDLKIKEIDTVNKFEKNKNIKNLNASGRDTKREGKYKNIYLSNLRLLEAYLRNDFKSIVDNMKKIKILDLDYRTRTVVQKAMNKFYFDQNQKLIKERNSNKSNKKNPKYKSFGLNRIFKSVLNNINNNKEISKDYNRIDSMSDSRNKRNNKINFHFSHSNLSKIKSLNILFQGRDNKSNNNTRSMTKKRTYLSNRGSIVSPKRRVLHLSLSSSCLLSSPGYPKQNKNKNSKYKSIELKKEKFKKKTITLTKKNKFSQNSIIVPENHKLNEFFNSKYLIKRNYIKKLSDRDLLFQKSILKSKNTPKIPFEFFNKAVSYQNADNSFSQIKSIVSNHLGYSEWKENLSEDKYRECLLNNRFERTLITSLDNKALYLYKMNIKKNKKKEEGKELLEDSSKFDKKMRNINNSNKKALYELDKKLNEIYEFELKRKNDEIEHKKEINKQIYRKLYRNKSAYERLRFKENFKNRLVNSRSCTNYNKININKSYYYLN